MAIETAVEREIMLADFGVAATFTPAAGGGGSIVGILDNDYEAADIGGSVSFAVSRPRFTCRTADVANASDGDSLVVEGINYVIRVVMNDGTGMTELMLEVA